MRKHLRSGLRLTVLAAAAGSFLLLSPAQAQGRGPEGHGTLPGQYHNGHNGFTYGGGYHGGYDRGGYGRGGYGYHGGYGYRGGWGPGAVVGGALLGFGLGAVVAGAYAPPPVYYAPPPVYVAPPGYYAPYAPY